MVTPHRKLDSIQITPEQRDLIELPRLLFVDFELTCGPGVTSDTQDIIEVGTCGLVLGTPVAESDSASIFIKPEHSAVTAFCTDLTGVTREMVANEPGFARRAPRLRELGEAFGADAWCSRGPDHTLLHRQCVVSGVENPLAGLRHIDIRSMVTGLVYKLTGSIRPIGGNAGVGLATALKELQIDFEGRPHRGRADAYNTARILEHLRIHLPARLVKPRATRVFGSAA